MTQQKITYEWTVEEIDEHGDITEVHFSDTFPGYPADGTDIGVTRRVYVSDLPKGDNNPNGFDLMSQSWAYIKDGKLPDMFEFAGGGNDAKVPQRFHNELTRKAA